MFKYLPSITKVVGHFASRASVLTISVCLIVVSVACQKPQVWQDYQPSNKDFTVRFPGKPSETTHTAALSNGEVKYPRVGWTGRGLILDISYQEIPDLRLLNGDETKEYYEFLRSQTISMNKSQLTEANDITINGKPGHDSTEVRPSGKVTRFRLFLVGTKLLMLRAEQDTNISPMAETSSTVQQFMTSLRFPE